MNEITSTSIVALRQRTGAGIMACKTHLLEADGDIDRAAELMRERGMRLGSISRPTTQGTLGVYVHPGNQMVSVLELACETDFVARNVEFQHLAAELAMQVCAMNPKAVSMADVSVVEIESEVRIAKSALLNDPKMRDKPAEMLERIAQEKVTKDLKAQCLMEQPYIRDGSQTVQMLLADAKIKFREVIVVRRFSRYAVGDAI